MDRTYESAVEIINSRQRQNRPRSSVESTNARPATGRRSNLRGTPNLVGMKEWLQMLGHTPENVNKLKVIHIAGTKGKGSTCAFTEAVLRSHGRRTGWPSKTGLYTSPHLINPEERIRINFKPMTRVLFAKYFFELYDRLPQLAHQYDPSKSPVDRGPRYLQLYALLAIHSFIREKVSVAIIETHCGGEYDATNVIAKPIVTAITTLGMDHVDMLGPSLADIAWHKGGIFKAGATALSAVQEAIPAKVLTERANAKGEKLEFIGSDARLSPDALQLRAPVQTNNASLAVAVAQAFLQRTSFSNTKRQLTTVDIHDGIHNCQWPGRFQILRDGKCTWFLDAAHNEMSVAIAAQWFVDSGARIQTTSNTTRVLIFSHINELRDAEALLQSLAQALREHEAGIEHVIFTTYSEREGQAATAAAVSATTHPVETERLHAVWRRAFPRAQIWDEPLIPEALSRARRLGEGRGMLTLVTGSQHLVGPALRLLLESGAVAP